MEKEDELKTAPFSPPKGAIIEGNEDPPYTYPVILGKNVLESLVFVKKEEDTYGNSDIFSGYYKDELYIGKLAEGVKREFETKGKIELVVVGYKEVF